MTGTLRTVPGTARTAETGLPAFVFIPVGLEAGKVLGTLVYGPVVFAVEGTYDDRRGSLKLGPRC